MGHELSKSIFSRQLSKSIPRPPTDSNAQGYVTANTTSGGMGTVSQVAALNAGPLTVSPSTVFPSIVKPIDLVQQNNERILQNLIRYGNPEGVPMSSVSDRNRIVQKGGQSVLVYEPKLQDQPLPVMISSDS